MSDPCPICGVDVGAIHRDGCSIERCRMCGGQSIGCGCKRKAAREAALGGRLAWSGEYPGKDQCREFGLWAYFDEPNCKWVRCTSDHPEASEDITRLNSGGFIWSGVDGKWVRS